MVLFRCYTCNRRFPTFHPDHMPLFNLQCLASCSVEVAFFDSKPKSERSKFASYHTGRCKKCHDDLLKADKDEITKGKGKFSLENQMDLLMGYDNPHNTHMPGHDVCAILKELGEHFMKASILESQLIALNHMQVDVCFLRNSTGLSNFRKNIISFPQDLLELKQFHSFLSNIKIHDVVNVTIKHPETGDLHHHRARVKELQAEGLLVDVDGEDKPIAVKFTDVTQRLKLPWKPEALYDYFIVFRRRDGQKNEYIEDLRVRKHFVTGILKLLTLKGNWRAHQGEEPLNKWYTGFDWLSDLEIEEAFPDDDIPEGVHFETLDDDCNSNLSFTLDVFLCWLTEGRYHCAVAQDLLRLWTYTLAGSKHETLYDFFSQASR